MNKQMLNKHIQRGLVAFGAFVASAAVMADPAVPDTTAITTAATTVGTIGAAVFLVYVGIKVFKWARSAL